MRGLVSYFILLLLSHKSKVTFLRFSIRFSEAKRAENFVFYYSISSKITFLRFSTLIRFLSRAENFVSNTEQYNSRGKGIKNEKKYASTTTPSKTKNDATS